MSRSDRSDSLVRWGLAAILLVAALNFAWQLGSSSYFVDGVAQNPALSGRLYTC